MENKEIDPFKHIKDANEQWQSQYPELYQNKPCIKEILKNYHCYDKVGIYRPDIYIRDIKNLPLLDTIKDVILSTSKNGLYKGERQVELIKASISYKLVKLENKSVIYCNFSGLVEHNMYTNKRYIVQISGRRQKQLAIIILDY